MVFKQSHWGITGMLQGGGKRGKKGTETRDRETREGTVLVQVQKDELSSVSVERAS